MTGIDLNRAGTPLLEIVSEPDMRSADEAVAYAKALHGAGALDRHLRRQHAGRQLPLRRQRLGAPRGRRTLGTRCEIKNLNSFRFMQQAIEFEVRRQIELIEDGGTVVQETRLYDPDRDETRSMRSKEDAQDYRYFPDPDLPPLAIDAAWIERVRAALPELPELRKLRFSATSPEHFIELVKGGAGVDLSDVSDEVFEEANPALQASLRKPTYALPIADATALVASRALADYFETLVDAGVDARQAAHWLLGEVAAALNRAEIDIDDAPVTPAALAKLIARVADGTISGKIAKDVFDAMWVGDARGDDAADAIIAARGLRQISDEGALAKLVDDVIAAHPAIVAELPRRQGQGVQRAGRQGDGRVEGPGESGAAQRAPEAQARRLTRVAGRREPTPCSARRATSSTRGSAATSRAPGTRARAGSAARASAAAAAGRSSSATACASAATRRWGSCPRPARCMRSIRGRVKANGPTWTPTAPQSSRSAATISRRRRAATGCSAPTSRTRSASRAGSTARSRTSTTTDNRRYWSAIEAAKRRLVAQLVALGPAGRVEGRRGSRARPRVRLPAATDGKRVLTGHANGIITVDVDEADDALREKTRLALHEPYRTLLGHLRHEVGHYYWDRLVAGHALARAVPRAVRRRARGLRASAARQLRPGPAGRLARPAHQRLRGEPPVGGLGGDLGALPAHRRRPRHGARLRALGDRPRHDGRALRPR